MRWPLYFLVALLAAGIFTMAAGHAEPSTISATMLAAIALPVLVALAFRPAAGVSTSVGAPPWAWSTLYGSLVLCSASVAILFDLTTPWWLPPAAGVALSVVVFGVFYGLWLAPMRAIANVRAFAKDPVRLEHAVRALVASFALPAASGRIGKQRRAIRALTATGVLMDVLRFDDAATVIGAVDPAAVQGETRAALLATRAVIALHSGARDSAFHALKEAARYAKSQPILDILVVNDALLEAQDGRGEEALERLERIAVPTDKPRLRSYLLARAHAFAAKGALDEAKAVVGELVRLDPDALERAAHLPGPAKPLLDAVLSDRA